MIALLALGLALAGASCHVPLGGDSCSESNCNAEGQRSCSGNVARSCSLYEGDPCIYKRWIDETDCTRQGGVCSAGECVEKTERCPAGAASFCRDGAAFTCVGDRVATSSVPCSGDRACQSVTLVDGRSGGVCALDATPCKQPGSSTECRGNALVYCSNGFAYSASACDAPGERCLERGALAVSPAQCALDAACPPNGASMCAGDRVYGCELGDAPIALRDCAQAEDECVTVAGLGLCATANVARPTAVWVPLPAGSFVMGPRRPDTPQENTEVTLPAYEMLEREVSVGEYATCVANGRCSAPSELAQGCWPNDRATRADLHADLPVTCVSFEQAQDYCGSLGGRVPSGAEWEYALRNAGEDVEFPWGDDEPDCSS